ncbi:MAG: DUF5309 domain-containing protein [Sulfitobacter sp.]|nr:DUF5309 domain-containing protein [Sulfitobacter sp.]
MATPYVGQVSAYDLTAGVKINMDEAIYLLSPIDTPMLTGTGGDGLSVLSSAPVDQVSFSWQDETNLTPESVLAANVVTAAAEIVIATGDQAKFSTGDLLTLHKVGATAFEYLRVTGYSATTADTLLVERGYDSTTATTYTTSSVVVGVGTALAEGSDPENARQRDRDLRIGGTQIWGPTKVQMSRTAQKVSRYGVPSEFNHQLMRRIEEMNIHRERTFVYGRYADDTSTKIRSTGSLNHYIETNVDSAVTQLTVTMIETNDQKTYDAGGIPKLLMTNPKSLGTLNAITDTGRVRQELVDSRRGRTPVTVVTTEFGDKTIVRNRWVYPGHAFSFSRENVIRRIFDPIVFERLAKTGDSDSGQLVGEEGLQVKGQNHCWKAVNLSAYPTV